MKLPCRTLLSLLAVACGGTEGTTRGGANRTHIGSSSSSLDVADRCAMIEAAFRLESFKKFACGIASTQASRVLVDVAMEPRFGLDESCASDVFAIYRAGQPADTDAVLKLSIWPRNERIWEFAASYFDPPNSPNDRSAGSDGFDDVNYYCGFIDGRLERSDGGWRAWVAEDASPLGRVKAK
jgi:hypothetical protein